MLRTLVDSYIRADRPHKAKKAREYEYDRLTTTPFLHGSEYLNELCDAAKKKEEYECILEHLYKHQEVGVLEIESYSTLERKIVDRYWK